MFKKLLTDFYSCEPDFTTLFWKLNDPKTVHVLKLLKKKSLVGVTQPPIKFNANISQTTKAIQTNLFENKHF